MSIELLVALGFLAICLIWTSFLLLLINVWKRLKHVEEDLQFFALNANLEFARADTERLTARVSKLEGLLRRFGIDDGVTRFRSRFD